MAQENIKIQNPNFCIGPQLGTLCTIDTTNPSTVLRVKDTGGNTVMDLSLSSNIVTTGVRLEYVGPPNLTELVDDLTFFTFERVTSTRCMIKRWQTRMAYRELLLKEQVIKNSSGENSYDAIDFAVEYYHRTLQRAIEDDNHLYLNSALNIKTGTRLFIGPSSDATNPGATEVLVVSHISEEFGFKKIYVTSTSKYQYAPGDFVSFYSHIYIYTNEIVPGDDRQGALIKHDAYTWEVVEKEGKAWYKRITASKWCPQVQGIASIMGTNMIFVKPYDSYQNWKSMFLNNVRKDKNTVFTVYDVVFDNATVYKLQLHKTYKESDGDLQTVDWNEYNYHDDTLSPYSNNLNIRLTESIATGYNKTMTIYGQVRDQFHVGLRDVIVSFWQEEDGDPDSYFWPYSGLATTDINGEVVMEYRTGHEFYGTTFISGKATGSTNATGSEFAWGKNTDIITYPYYSPLNVLIYQKKSVSGIGAGRQLPDPYKFFGELENPTVGQISPAYRLPNIMLIGRNYFTSPGGDWGSGDGYLKPYDVLEYLPMLYEGSSHTDGPSVLLGAGYGFEAWPYEVTSGDKPYFIGNQIRLVETFNSENTLISTLEYRIHHGIAPPDPNDPTKKVSVTTGWPPYVYVKQPDESDAVQISQLKLSLHTHWLDGVAYKELVGYVNIDQFVFVEDAIPKFWSEKNPVETDVWIRLRPFAFSLDNDTLRMWLKVVSSKGDTGWYEITDSIVLDNFDAGGNNLGIEVFYDPPEDFPYGALVYVYIEVYDEAYIPNFIMVEYWWYTTPDYKAPYLTNLSPSREEENVMVDVPIKFDIEDKGTGIDLNSFEFLLNSRIMDPDYVEITVLNEKHVSVVYTPPVPFYYSKDYKVTVKCRDSSAQHNEMNDSYTFYTTDSTGIYITDPVPKPCKRGMSRFEDVSVVVLADGNGIDRSTIRMQVYNKDIHPRITPIVYRLG